MKRMSQKKQNELSQDMYHRIYRLAKRNVRAAVIAQTLRLPIDLIQSIVERLMARDKSPAHKEDRPKTPPPAPEPEEPFLDTVVVLKSHFAILDIGGMLTAINKPQLEKKLKEMIASTHKTLALRLTNAREIDEEGAQELFDFHAAFISKGRYAAILDPSPRVEHDIDRLGLDQKIPVFGTEIAFEEHAFKGDHEKKRK
jgi:anti-anti-sigma regulatory factor